MKNFERSARFVQSKAASFLIRDAKTIDAEFIAEIWNLAIRDSVATFNSVEKSSGEIVKLLEEKQRQTHPFLVCVGRGVEGFATYGQFRSGIGYSRTMEHTIHFAPQARGQGRGTALMAELERRAAENGVHSMIAGISGENLDAIRFHACNRLS